MGGEGGEERVGELGHEHVHVEERVHLHGDGRLAALSTPPPARPPRRRRHLLVLAKGDTERVWKDLAKQRKLLLRPLQCSKCTSTGSQCTAKITMQTNTGCKYTRPCTRIAYVHSRTHAQRKVRKYTRPCTRIRTLTKTHTHAHRAKCIHTHNRKGTRVVTLASFNYTRLDAVYQTDLKTSDRIND